MSARLKGLATALLGLALGSWSVVPSFAQKEPIAAPPTPAPAGNSNFRIAPGVPVNQPSYNTAVLGQGSGTPAYATPAPQASPYSGIGSTGMYSGLGANPMTATIVTSPYGGLGAAPSSPYSGGGGYAPPVPYGSNYVESPYAGYLRGAADLTNANGRYYGQIQEARKLRAEADMRKLDLRERIAAEAAIERKNWLNPEAERLKDKQAAYARAASEAPIGEILSGQALNDLYNHIAPLQNKGVKGPNVPLDPEMIKQLNLTGAAATSGLGMLKDRGKLNWPLVLQNAEFDKDRKRLSSLSAEVVDQIRVSNKPVDGATLRDMKADLARLNETLLRNISEFSLSDYVEAKRFLSNLGGAIDALRDPNVANHFNQEWAARARNVAELVDQMSQKGLKFAPAAAGDEPAYRHVYQRLVAFDAGLTQVSTAGGN